MTREEKAKKIILCLNRTRRLIAFTEVANKWNELDVTMKLAMRTVFTAIEANRLASQPTEDMKHPNPKFPSGGISIGNNN